MPVGRELSLPLAVTKGAVDPNATMLPRILLMTCLVAALGSMHKAVMTPPDSDVEADPAKGRRRAYKLFNVSPQGKHAP